jgi:hypothetical protein
VQLVAVLEGREAKPLRTLVIMGIVATEASAGHCIRSRADALCHGDALRWRALPKQLDLNRVRPWVGVGGKWPHQSDFIVRRGACRRLEAVLSEWRAGCGTPKQTAARFARQHGTPHRRSGRWPSDILVETRMSTN